MNLLKRRLKSIKTTRRGVNFQGIWTQFLEKSCQIIQSDATI
jgi:hypothetical protein